MKFKFIFTVSAISSFMIIMAPLKAEEKGIIPPAPDIFVLVQRNCDPGDLTISKESGEQAVTTNCIWQKQRVDSNGNKVLDKNGQPINEDADMQVTLHVTADVDYVVGRCIYTPAINSGDKVVDVSTSKAGSLTGSVSPSLLPDAQYSISPNSTNIRLVFKLNKKGNFDENTQTYQANVIFDLNKNRVDRWYSPIAFNAGNKIACSFQPSTTNELPPQ